MQPNTLLAPRSTPQVTRHGVKPSAPPAHPARRIRLHCAPPTPSGTRGQAEPEAPAAQGPAAPRLGQEDAAWYIGFQCNERTLQWDQGAQKQLVKLYAAGKLGVSVEEVEGRIADLGVLLPDMVSKLEAIKGDILAALLHDIPALAWKLLGLKELLPSCNVSMLVARHPPLVLQYSKEEVAERLDSLRQQLPGVRVEALLDVEPRLLAADIPAVLAEIRRLLPNADPVRMLVAEPLAVLDMGQAGLPSSLEDERQLG